MPQLSVGTRSGRIERIHEGYICATDSDNKIVGCIGKPETRLFIRSSGKPFYAVPLVRSGAIEKYGLSLDELAVICSSHSGQEFHKKAISSALHKIGLSENDLDCGSIEPQNKEMANNLIRMNRQPASSDNWCSGKHVGMLALCRFYNYPISGYTSPEHPVQRLIRMTLSELLSLKPHELVLGQDNCSTPTYLLTMHQLSYLYALLAQGYEGSSPYRDCFGLIQKAMITYPHMIHGDGEFCTDLTRHTGGRAIGKVGSDGIYCISVPEKRLGVCIKITDGNEWGVYPAAIRILEEMGIIDAKTREKLKEWALPPLVSDKGKDMGYIYPTFSFADKTAGSHELGEIYPGERGSQWCR